MARRLGARHATYSTRTFPDGETKLTLRGRITGHAVVVRTSHPGADSALLQALTLVSRAAGEARRVTAVIPYMGYARQDRQFLAGELVTMRHVGRLLRCAGASRVVVVDIHSGEALRCLRGGRNVSAVPALAAHVIKMGLRDPVAVSPDAGGARRAAHFAREAGCGLLVLGKKRDRRTGRVSVSADARDMAGRDAVIVDDMISTGGSVAAAARLLRGAGCRRVHAACTHALLVGGARAAMRRAGVSSIIGANTVPGPASVVDVSGAVAGAIAP
ncbi:MAG: ribose-phosphate diphosphokinase [Nitrosopumilus sp.]|nr:ribose-phosphate diphosphokinase [Nitrosopumilus sp.]MDA7942498.1 ribose-phosphate diphosphokinase [Nitrosopumilus sp.]